MLLKSCDAEPCIDADNGRTIWISVGNVHPHRYANDCENDLKIIVWFLDRAVAEVIVSLWEICVIVEYPGDPNGGRENVIRVALQETAQAEPKDMQE